MLDTAVIARLRDQLLSRGVPSLLPAPGASLDALAPYQRAALARVTPLAELLFLVMSADGDAHSSEVDALRGALRTLTDGLLRGAAADQLVEQFREGLDREGLEGRMEAVTARLSADREDAEVAVMLAAAVALADGRVDPGEHALFELVVGHLGVGRRRVDELLGRR